MTVRLAVLRARLAAAHRRVQKAAARGGAATAASSTGQLPPRQWCDPPAGCLCASPVEHALIRTQGDRAHIVVVADADEHHFDAALGYVGAADPPKRRSGVLGNEPIRHRRPCGCKP